MAGGCASPTSGSKTERKNNESKTYQSEQKIDELKVAVFAHGGYDSGTAYATETTTQTIDIEHSAYQLSVIQPKRNGKYPLVIYLPGLGESNNSAEKIRKAWATSGYVVISIQLLKDDEEILSTPAAKEKDFSFIRHDRYSPEVISNRLGMLSKLVAYLQQLSLIHI